LDETYTLDNAVTANSFVLDVCLDINGLVVAKIREFIGEGCNLYWAGEGISVFDLDVGLFDFVINIF
jgi:hypothetical protein